MSRGVSGGTFAAALLALALGTGLIWLATWLAPLTAADLAVRDGRLTDGLDAFRTAESRLSRVPALQQLAPGILGSVQANQVRLLYQMQRYDEAIEKAGDSTSVYGTHFWSGCAMFARASAEEQAQTRLEWFERAEAAFRSALEARPDDWDTKFNYELTHSLLNRLREQPETPRRLLFELIRPQAPRSGGTAPPRRTG
jgi:tetratricopeptide (TPR) repeat protein